MALDTVERLSTFPFSGRFVPEIRNNEIRELIYGSYHIIYQVGKAEVNIVTIVHAMRDFKGL